MSKIIFYPVNLSPALKFPGPATGQVLMDFNMTEFDGLNRRF
jgi:hypothetical protein